MPKFDLAVPHTMGKEVALERLQGFSAKLQEHYADQVKDLQQTWEGDRLDFSFKTFGFTISGELEVKEDQIHVSGNLPLAASMAKGKITSAIEEQIQKLLK